MARNWIKIETVTPGKPEVCVMATHLRLDPDMVTGKLVRVWSWAEVNRIKGNDLGVTREFLDKLAGKKGFAAAMERCGWLKEEDGKLVFPNFQRHNGPNGKGRALTAMRVARHRFRKREGNENEMDDTEGNRDESVTESVISTENVRVPEEIKVVPEPVTLEAEDDEISTVVPEADVTESVEDEDDNPRKKRSKAASAGPRRSAVAETPDQPLLFGL